MSSRFNSTIRVAGACLAFAITAFSSLALAKEEEEHEHERGIRPIPLLPLYQQECASCHIAFPPGMLPASSWQRIMNNLKHHYGADASLDEAAVKQLEQWLTTVTNRTQPLPEPPEDRITRSAWFVHTHHEVAASVWSRPAIKSAANCAACHNAADPGNFSEHYVRIPAVKP
ncbi:MAG: diheme cytochrome c [Rhodanobacter sp.]|jgi:mono/diheme cytochrome c family protein|nr:diheme cytochrome c [Rhodanobacter sp.]